MPVHILIKFNFWLEVLLETKVKSKHLSFFFEPLYYFFPYRLGGGIIVHGRQILCVHQLRRNLHLRL